jgi:pimeloyl-ACP methyl ester carboxylesterase
VVLQHGGGQTRHAWKGAGESLGRAGYHAVAFDARGHGASDKPAGEPVEVYAMDLTAQDLAAVASAVKDRLGPGAPLHYASHSLGGIAAVLLEGRFGEAPFASLTLFEPPIYPSETSPHYETALASSPLFTRWSAKRREHFPDRDALRREAMAISTFASFAPEMMDAYVAAAAYETAEGDLALYCPGAVESAFYANCPAARVYEACAGMRTPAVVFSSDPAVVDAGHVWTPASMREVAAAMADGRYAVMPGCRHLMVQEQPAACAERVVAHVAECVTA